MTINDRGRNQAQAGRALHAPAEARRAFRDLARAKAAKPLERRPGQQGVGRVRIGNIAAVLFGSGFHFPACFFGFQILTAKNFLVLVKSIRALHKKG